MQIKYFLRPKKSDQFPNMGMGAYAFGYTANSPRPVRPVTLAFPQNTNFTQKIHFVQSISCMLVAVGTKAYFSSLHLSSSHSHLLPFSKLVNTRAIARVRVVNTPCIHWSCNFVQLFVPGEVQSNPRNTPELGITESSCIIWKTPYW